VFARSVGHTIVNDMFDGETAWLKAVEKYWRAEDGRAVLKLA